GVDLKVGPTLDSEGQRALVDGINRLFAGWYSFPRPVVCAVNGHAVAGGMILALCGDYRVGSTEGKLGLTELRVGIAYPSNAIAARPRRRSSDGKLEAVELPQRARVPEQRHRDEERPAGERQRPAGQAPRAHHGHLGHERAVEEAAGDRVHGDARVERLRAVG